MRKLLIILFLLLFPIATAAAQDSYTFNLTNGQTSRVDIARVVHNERTCTNAGLPLDCSEAQVQAVGGDFASAQIYPNTTQGRQDLIQDTVLVPWFLAILDEQRGWDTEKAQILWMLLDRNGKDAVCSAIGLSDGCELY